MPKYLKDEAQAIKDAKQAYLEALEKLQAACEHDTILKHETASYVTYRVCEDCGLHESHMWDSPYKYKHQALTKRAYGVDWSEYYKALPKVERD